MSSFPLVAPSSVSEPLSLQVKSIAAAEEGEDPLLPAEPQLFLAIITNKQPAPADETEPNQLVIKAAAALELSSPEPIAVDIGINDTITTTPKTNVQFQIDSAYKRVSNHSQTMDQGLTSVAVEVDAENPLFSMTVGTNQSTNSRVALPNASNNNKIADRVAVEMFPWEARLQDGKERQMIPIRSAISWKFRRKRELENGGRERNGEEGSRRDDGICKMAVAGSKFAGLGIEDGLTIQGCVGPTMGGLTRGLLYEMKPSSGGTEDETMGWNGAESRLGEKGMMEMRQQAYKACEIHNLSQQMDPCLIKDLIVGTIEEKGTGDGSDKCDLILKFGRGVWFPHRVAEMEVPSGALLLFGGLIQVQEIRVISEVKHGVHGRMVWEEEFHSLVLAVEEADLVGVTHSFTVEMKLLYIEIVDVGFVRVPQRSWKFRIREREYMEPDIGLQRSLFPNSALRTFSVDGNDEPIIAQFECRSPTLLP
ncbi:unnamed protein product [Linum trigynum]|uniref:Uncharacterized protein n=1 Tax=Linum trigynum TaxID=586398 RepID=A0AAV2DUK5_9ROSI